LPRIKLVLAYDGTNYCGWQLQPNGISVQQVLEEALAKILGSPHRVHAAGRTDSGVHALGQVATFKTERDIPVATLLRALNGTLPEDVAVDSVEEVPDDFNPQKAAKTKLYRYRIFDSPVRPVLVRDQVWQVFNVDWGNVEAAARHLVGRHDFTTFRAMDCSAKSPVRTLTRLEVIRRPAEREVWIEFEGPGFLKHMVRNIVGWLMRVGRGFESADRTPEILAAKDRTLAGPMAPAAGLTLVRVDY
jgi:tRNA pseudouridine38-40 synthase